MLGSYKQLTMFELLGNQASVAKTALLANDSYLGNKLGSFFDMTESLPKLALYLSKLDTTGSKDTALQSVVGSFPQYRNLIPIFGMVDLISPYTKFFLSLPRMMAYNFMEKPRRTIGIGIGLNYIPYYLNMASIDNKKEDWYNKHVGMILFGDIGISINSATNMYSPLDWFSYKPTAVDLYEWAKSDIEKPEKLLKPVYLF